MNKKGFTLVELLAVIVILAVIILIAVNAVLPQMQKARKKSFADEGLSFAKAAENYYVDNQLSGTQCVTVANLKGQYVTKSDSDYVGKIIVNANDDGSITGKTIYLKNSKWKIVNVTADALGADLEDKVVPAATATEASPAWTDAMASCE